jgi:hypothetical protein
MKSVSFIVNGDQATPQQWAKINALIDKNSKGYTTPVRIIAYASEPVEHIDSKNILFVTSRNNVVTAFAKAVASASSENLVFTTVGNILADKTGEMIKQASSLSEYLVAAPLLRAKISSAAGLRRIQSAPYFIFSKQFTVNHPDLIRDPEKAIVYANKKLAFLALEPVISGNLDSVIQKLIFGRPYRTIATNIVCVQKERIKAKIANRRAEKLRIKVRPVTFSPDIPVFIICRDRVEPLKELVKWCEDEGLTTIVFVDNASTYPPLLTFLEQTSHEVLHLTSNIGHTAAWDMGIISLYAGNGPFIVSDPDIIPLKGAHGAVRYFCELLTAHPERTKVGFGLKIDDLPDYYALKNQVIAWEKQFWASSVEKDVFDAEIDTTFAVYRQHTPYTLGPGLRTGGKFVARHEPWYTNSSKPSDEIRYYRQHANKTIGTWGVTLTETATTYQKMTSDHN